jgi:hypothetical protein
MTTLCHALSRSYGISLTIPTRQEVAEIHQDLLQDVASGSMWLSHAEAEILVTFNAYFQELIELIRDALPTPQALHSHEADELNQCTARILTSLRGLSGQEIGDDIRDDLRLLVQAVMAERDMRNYHAMSAEEQRAWMRNMLRHRVKDRIVRIASYAVLHTKLNWVAPGEPHRARRSDGTVFFETSSGTPLPPGESPTLTLTIDLPKVHLVGVTALAKKVTLSVKQALAQLPTEWHTFSQALGFLRTITWEDFERDIQRFDLRKNHHLSRRQIAWLEAAARRGHPLPSSPQRLTIGKSIPGEDSVEKAVNRIAIATGLPTSEAHSDHRDPPAHDFEEYACPIHPLRNCPLTCPTSVAYMERFDAGAPTDTTGRGKEIVSLDDVEEKVGQDGRTWKRRGNRTGDGS